jgi:hypothetical protein
MRKMHHEWEGVARDLLERANAEDPPVDAFDLADCWDFSIEVGARGADVDLEKRLIRLTTHARRERQHMLVAHELGHFGLWRAGMANTEDGARYIGGAIMLPRRRFDRDLRDSWSIPRLRAIHSNASAQAIAVRITQLRDAVCAVVDPCGRKAPWRRMSPWISDPRVEGKRLTRWERDLAARAWELREEVCDPDSANCYAIPVPDEEGNEHRVIVVVEYQQLSLRL